MANGDERATTGNKVTAALRNTFRKAKEAVPKTVKEGIDLANKGARVVGQGARTAVNETSRLGANLAGGFLGIGGKSAPEGQSRAGKVASRLANTFSGGAPRGAGAVGGAGVQVGLEITPAERAARAGRLATAGRAIAGGVGAIPVTERITDAFTQNVGRIPANIARTNPLTAPVASLFEKGLRLAGGESGGQASLNTARSGLSAAGIPGIEPESDPLDLGGPTPIELGRQTFGIQGGEEPAAPAPEQPAAASGLRTFTNADARAAAAGTSPGLRRGTASVEENQGVASRLEANQNLGVAAAGQPQNLDERVLQGLADNARGGGLASAFLALGAGRNVLQRQATERARETGFARAQQDADNELRDTFAGQQAAREKNQLTADRDRGAAVQNIFSGLEKAQASGNEEQFLDTTFRVASNNPTGPEAQVALPMVGAEIREKAGKGLLTAVNPATERGIFDWLSSLGQGGQAEPLVTPEGQVTINAQTGNVEIVSRDGSTRQDLISVDDLPPRSQELLRAAGTQLSEQQLASQAGDPNLRGRGALTLRNARQ